MFLCESKKAMAMTLQFNNAGGSVRLVNPTRKHVRSIYSITEIDVFT